MTFFTRPGAIFVILAIVASLCLSVVFPLLTYGTGLALFGVAHVLSELRFVDQRFSSRISTRFAVMLGILLAGVLGTRIAIVFNLAPLRAAYNVELALVFLLALSALINMPSASFKGRLISLMVTVFLGVGFLISPLSTILLLAVLHNLTPIGFIVDIVPTALKRHALLLCSMCFLVLPLMISCGIISTLFAHVIEVKQNFTLFPTGPLERHLHVFLPESFTRSSWAAHGFSAIVFAQCMHYLAVIYIMPKLSNNFSSAKTVKPLFPWPTPLLFWLLTAAATAILVLLYAKDFFWARSFYSIAAALHAYIEIPLLLWAFSFIPTVATKKFQPLSMSN